MFSALDSPEAKLYDERLATTENKQYVRKTLKDYPKLVKYINDMINNQKDLGLDDHKVFDQVGVRPSDVCEYTPLFTRPCRKGYQKWHIPAASSVSTDYCIVIDFECTCDEVPDYNHEIIEFPAVLLNSRTMLIESVFHSYVRPTEIPTLTPFCTRLTGITQGQVDIAPTLPVVLVLFEAWLKSMGIWLPMGMHNCQGIVLHQAVNDDGVARTQYRLQDLTAAPGASPVKDLNSSFSQMELTTPTKPKPKPKPKPSPSSPDSTPQTPLWVGSQQQAFARARSLAGAQALANGSAARHLSLAVAAAHVRAVPEAPASRAVLDIGEPLACSGAEADAILAVRRGNAFQPMLRSTPLSRASNTALITTLAKAKPGSGSIPFEAVLAIQRRIVLHNYLTDCGLLHGSPKAASSLALTDISVAAFTEDLYLALVLAHHPETNLAHSRAFPYTSGEPYSFGLPAADSEATQDCSAVRVGLGRALQHSSTALLATDGPWDLVKFLIPEAHRKRLSLLLSSTLGMSRQIRFNTSYFKRACFELACHGILVTEAGEPLSDLPLPGQDMLIRVPIEEVTQPEPIPGCDMGISYPSGSPSLQYLNQRKYLSNLLCKNLLPFNTRKGDNFSVNAVLGYFCMTFKGREHSGLADSLNIARILAALIWHGSAACTVNVEYAVDMSLVPTADQC